jgi:hypothetical protein
MYNHTLNENPLALPLTPYQPSPWLNLNNPNPYETKREDPNKAQHTLDHYLTRGHYTMAYRKASTSKAQSPDVVPNEIIKFLPDTTHYLIFTLFKLMAKHSYTPQKGCGSATKLIYKPNKSDPQNSSNYRPFALMN